MDANQILWEMPVPVTAILQGPRFNVLPERKCEISFSIEGEDGSEKWQMLFFYGVEAFKVTHLTSLGSVNLELRRQAYGKLISITESLWLADINKSYASYCDSAHLKQKRLQHLMFFFDDGPCYEFVCESFKLPGS
jgi:hypothetical protein